MNGDLTAVGQLIQTLNRLTIGAIQSASGVTNDTTEVTVVAAPAIGKRLVETLTFSNLDSAGVVVRVYLKTGATRRRFLNQTLAAGADFQFDKMMYLDAADKSIVTDLAGAVAATQPDWTAHYRDIEL